MRAILLLVGAAARPEELGERGGGGGLAAAERGDELLELLLVRVQTHAERGGVEREQRGVLVQVGDEGLLGVGPRVVAADGGDLGGGDADGVEG